MTQTTLTAAIVVLVVSLVAAPVAAAGLAGPIAVANAQEQTPSATPADGDVAPGERLSAAVTVQNAELAGEVDERTFGITVARSASANATADVVAEQLADVERRLAELEQRKQTLLEARANGSIGEGTFRAEMAELAVETATAGRLANQTEAVASDLPADVLESKGINVSAIQTLKTRAANLTGPQVAKIAQSIAGASVGTSMAGENVPGDLPDAAGNGTDVAGEDRPDAAGDDRPGDGVSDANDTDGNASVLIESAEASLQEARQQVDSAREQVEVADDDEASAALERAEANLTAAEEALTAARESLEAGDEAQARQQAGDALEHARDAIDHARDALEAVRDGGGAP